MEEKREMSVKELIKMFVTISYFQEQRIFKFSDVYDYIYNCYHRNSDEYRKNIQFSDLLDEADVAIDDLVSDGTLSYVYPDGICGLYRINKKNEFFEITNYLEDYIKDMNKVFLDIIGGEPMELKLTLSNAKKINR